GPVFNTWGEVVGILTTKFMHPSGIVPEGMAFVMPVSYATPLLANIEEFDFTTIGKKRKGNKGTNGKGLAHALARTTVIIETVRVVENASIAASASTESSGKTEAAAAPIIRGQAGASRESFPPLPDDATVQRVNEQIRLAQQEELQRLT